MAKKKKQIELDWELHTIVGGTSVARLLCDLLVEKGLGRFVGNQFEFYQSKLKNLENDCYRMSDRLMNPLQEYLSILIAGGSTAYLNYSPDSESLEKLSLNATGCSIVSLSAVEGFNQAWFKKVTSDDLCLPLSQADGSKLFSSTYQALNYVVGESNFARNAIGVIKGNAIVHLLVRNRWAQNQFKDFLLKSKHSWIFVLCNLENCNFQQNSQQSSHRNAQLQYLKIATTIINNVNKENVKHGKPARVDVVIKKDKIGQEGIFFDLQCALLYASVGTPSLEKYFLSTHPSDGLSLEEKKILSRLKGDFRVKQAATRS